MRAGWIIGVPLTILQWGIHSHTGAVVDAPTVVNNFVICNAVYDADRLTEPSPARLRTRVSAIASAAYYATSPETEILVPVVIGLHTGYTSCKPYIAPIKPFFVAFFWTIAVYYVPMLRSPEPVAYELWSPASLFLSIAALSHAVDIVDTTEDLNAGVLTPAVRMGKDEALQFALACGFASAWLHSKSVTSFPLYDVLVLTSIVGIARDSSHIVGVLTVLFISGYTYENKETLLAQLLQSTEGTHKMAIDLTTDTVRHAKDLPEPWRHGLVNLVFRISEVGDTFGHKILDVYERVVREGLM